MIFKSLNEGRAAVCAAILLIFTASSPALAQTTTSTPQKKVITGKASFYGGSDGLDSNTTANGDTFDHHDHTAAARTIPLGSKARGPT